MCSLFSDTLISSKAVLQPAQHARQCPSGPTKQHPPVCSTHSCLPTYLTGYDDSPATVAIRQLSGPHFFSTWAGNLYHSLNSQVVLFLCDCSIVLLPFVFYCSTAPPTCPRPSNTPYPAEMQASTLEAVQLNLIHMVSDSALDLPCLFEPTLSLLCHVPVTCSFLLM